MVLQNVPILIDADQKENGKLAFARYRVGVFEILLIRQCMNVSSHVILLWYCNYWDDNDLDRIGFAVICMQIHSGDINVFGRCFRTIKF